MRKYQEPVGSFSLQLQRVIPYPGGIIPQLSRDTISKSALPGVKTRICWKGSGRVTYPLATLILIQFSRETLICFTTKWDWDPSIRHCEKQGGRTKIYSVPPMQTHNPPWKNTSETERIQAPLYFHKGTVVTS